MQENMRFCHVAYSMKRIEIPINHIRDKNKFKNRLFIYFSSMFQDYFCYIIIQCFKTTNCFIWYNISRFFISHTHTQKPLFISIHHFHFYSFIYTSIAFHTIPSQIHLDKKMMSFTFNLSMTPT